MCLIKAGITGTVCVIEGSRMEASRPTHQAPRETFSILISFLLTMRPRTKLNSPVLQNRKPRQRVPESLPGWPHGLFMVKLPSRVPGPVAWAREHLASPTALRVGFPSRHLGPSSIWTDGTARTQVYINPSAAGLLPTDLFHPSSPDSGDWQSGISDFQRCLSLDKYILLITLCLPKVAKAEDQVAKRNSIHHRDKH